MKGFAVCAFIAVLVGGLAVPQDLAAEWKYFKAQHGKHYSSEEDAMRMQRFTQSLAEIEAHNARFAAGQESFSRQLNRYSDFTDEELGDQIFGTRPVDDETPIALADTDVHHLGDDHDIDLPINYDMEQMGCITPVKDQLSCGSCYAFAAVALLEAHVKRKTCRTLDLSEQEMIDCTYKKYLGNLYNLGCNGGWPTFVLDYAIKNGITPESCYPYTSGTRSTHGTCEANNTKADLLVTGLKLRHVTVENEEVLRKLLFDKGALIVVIGADRQYRRSFTDLKDGIYDVPSGPNVTPNHAVLLTGYGHERGKPFWRFKNSWGYWWGNSGYGKLARCKNMANILRTGAWYLESLEEPRPSTNNGTSVC